MYFLTALKRAALDEPPFERVETLPENGPLMVRVAPLASTTVIEPPAGIAICVDFASVVPALNLPTDDCRTMTCA